MPAPAPRGQRKNFTVRNLDEYRAVLFDCDGVILDSNAAKTAAFRSVLADQPAAAVEQFVAEHLASGGVSRYVKLRRFFTELVEVEDPEVSIAAALAHYSEQCRAALAKVPLVPGLVPLLDRLRVPAYVISGADQDEVREVLASRDLAHRFAGIFGSPAPKEQHLGRLAAAGELGVPGLFFGDARRDMEVAEAAGLDFVFVAGFSDWGEGARICATRGHRVIVDLAGV